MYRIAIAILLILFSVKITAQESSATLDGYILDGDNARPLRDVNVYLEGTAYGTASDSAGYYRIRNIPAGTYRFTVQMLGYRSFQETILLKAGEQRRIYIDLSPAPIEGPEITVESQRYRVLTSPGYTLQPTDIASTPGALEDVMRAVQTLAGVVSISDFSNRLIVRGGNPDQNLVIIDDVEIFNPYRLSGLASIFNPNLVQSIDVHTGGFQVHYGDRLSSVVDVKMREGTTTRWLSGTVNVNLTDFSATFEGKLPLWNGSWLVGTRKTYYDLVARWSDRQFGFFNRYAFPDFADVQGKIILRPSPRHRFHIIGMYNRDELDLSIHSPATEGRTVEQVVSSDLTTHVVFGTSWFYTPSPEIQLKVYANRYRLSEDNLFAGNFLPSDEFNPDYLMFPNQPPPPPILGAVDTISIASDKRIRFEKTSAGLNLFYMRDVHAIEFGGGIDVLQNNIAIDTQKNPFANLVFDAMRTAPNLFGSIADSLDHSHTYYRSYAYLLDKWEIIQNRLVAQIGIRYDYYDIIHRGYVSPRLGFALYLDPVTTFRVAWGVYYQSPGYEKIVEEGSMFDLSKFERVSPLLAEKSIHYVAGLTRWLSTRWQARLDIYAKEFDRLIVQEAGSEQRIVGILDLANRNYGRGADPRGYRIEEIEALVFTTQPANHATGFAYGFEFFIDRRVTDQADRWSGTVSYSLGYANRTREFLEERIRLPFEYDRRHTLNIIFNRRFGSSFLVGATWRFGTGFPTTPAVRYEPIVATVESPNQPGETGNIILTDPETGYAYLLPAYGDPRDYYSLRLPVYHRLDIRLTYRLRFLSMDVEVYTDLINTYKHQNVLRYRYSVYIEEDLRDLPEYLKRPATPVLIQSPVYMFPFIVSGGISVSF
jgi:hypothetical protein